MWWSPKWIRFTEWCCRRRIILLLLCCLLAITFYSISGTNNDLENFDYVSFRSYSNSTDNLVDGYLVWNPKCHMLSKDPMDTSIANFIKKMNYEACHTSPHLTYIAKETNGSFALAINAKAALQYRDFTCCWSSIDRPSTTPPVDKNIDSKIIVGNCEKFGEKAVLPKEVDALLVKCSVKTTTGDVTKVKVKGNVKHKVQSIYENVHPILNPEKVQDRLNTTENGFRSKKLSVLMLGIDNVSRLNFQRSLPKTAKYLHEKGWITMKGYNKMGENTFPNLMAILTGQSVEQSYARCKPKEMYGLNNCSMLWYAFHNVGYVTAYGEDAVRISTFNFLKSGFVQPPTDYYMRPYMLASERLLKIRRRFYADYCSGPELSMERIFDYGVEFAKTFIGVPTFSLFWSNTVSHDDINGVSTVDDRVLDKFQDLERAGVMNDSMIVFLSDHGMRYGNVRNTFVGWYEERLPFLNIWLPEWFREEDPEAYNALQINQNRLTSPFDLHMTLRDILIRAGGEANVSAACASCSTLFRPVPYERGCEDVGVTPHWCTCTAFKPRSTTDNIALDSAKILMDHIEEIIKEYKDKNGKRLCAKLRIKKIHRVDEVVDIVGLNSTAGAEYFFMLEVSPGGGKFEATIRHYGAGNYSLSNDEISRINSYSKYAKCLDHGLKQYCYCVNNTRG